MDLDEHIWQVRPFELSKYISRRKADFVSGMMEACYIVFNGEAVVVNAKEQTRREIEFIINELSGVLIGQILLVAFSSYEILIVIDNLVNHITKHIKIKGKITHFATNLLILQ